jgi:hypothetical protein
VEALLLTWARTSSPALREPRNPFLLQLVSLPRSLLFSDAPSSRGHPRLAGAGGELVLRAGVGYQVSGVRISATTGKRGHSSHRRLTIADCRLNPAGLRQERNKEEGESEIPFERLRASFRLAQNDKVVGSRSSQAARLSADALKEETESRWFHD